MAQHIRELMTPNPVSMPGTASVHEAARAMRDADIGDVIVIEHHHKPGHDVLYTSGSVSRLDFLGRNPLSWPSHQLLKTSLCTTPCSVLQNFDSKIIVAA